MMAPRQAEERLDEGKQRLADGLLGERLEEIAADVAEHDKALMEIIRRRSRDGAFRAPDPETTTIEQQLELIDRTADVYDRLAPSEKRLFEALLRSSLERRRHLAFLLCLPDDDRVAIGFVFGLDGRQRGELARDAEAEASRTEIGD